MYLLTTFARTVGAKDKKYRKKRLLQIGGALAGTALLGAVAYKNKNKIGNLLKKKPAINVPKEAPKQILALPAAGQSSSPVNKVKNELDDLFVETTKKARRTNPNRDLDSLDNIKPNRVLTTPANMTKKEINRSKVLARKKALGRELQDLNSNSKNIKRGKREILRAKNRAKQTDIDVDERVYAVKASKSNQKQRIQKQAELKTKVKSKLQDLRKSNPSLYHLNKLIEFGKLCTY